MFLWGLDWGYILTWRSWTLCWSQFGEFNISIDWVYPLKVAIKAAKSKTNSCPFLQKEISTQEQYCSTWSQHPTPATQHAPLPPLTPLHKQRSRVSRLTASASVSTISPTDALEEHFMAVNSEQLCTGTTANVALKYEVGSNLIFYSRKLTWLHCTGRSSPSFLLVLFYANKHLDVVYPKLWEQLKCIWKI